MSHPELEWLCKTGWKLFIWTFITRLWSLSNTTVPFSASITMATWPLSISLTLSVQPTKVKSDPMSRLYIRKKYTNHTEFPGKKFHTLYEIFRGKIIILSFFFFPISKIVTEKKLFALFFVRPGLSFTFPGLGLWLFPTPALSHAPLPAASPSLAPSPFPLPALG